MSHSSHSITQTRSSDFLEQSLDSLLISGSLTNSSANCSISLHSRLLIHEFTGTAEIEVTLRLAVSQSVSLGVEPHLGLMTRYILLFDNYGLAFAGNPLWREDGSVSCVCCWRWPALSFSGPSPLGLTTVFYSLRFETSLFVASYDSQGHGVGIRPRLHTGGTAESCSPPWNKVLPPRIEDIFSKGNFSSVVPIVTGMTFVNIRCGDNNCLPSRGLAIATIRSLFVVAGALIESLLSKCSHMLLL
jgi:hypothetical protein